MRRNSPRKSPGLRTSPTACRGLVSQHLLGEGANMAVVALGRGISARRIAGTFIAELAPLGDPARSPTVHHLGVGGHDSWNTQNAYVTHELFLSP